MMPDFTDEKTTFAQAAMSQQVASTKVEHRETGDIVLIPQPTDDPEDPLVSPSYSSKMVLYES